jgi:hypothetical protein
MFNLSNGSASSTPISAPAKKNNLLNQSFVFVILQKKILPYSNQMSWAIIL